MNSFTGLEKFSNWLLNHSLQAGLLVGLVLVVQFAFRRHLTNRWRFALWWVVLIRMILPLGPESPLSVFNLWQPSVHLRDASRRAPIRMIVAPDLPEAQSAEPNAIRTYNPYYTRQNRIQDREQPLVETKSGTLQTSSPTVNDRYNSRISARQFSLNHWKDWILPVLAGIWFTGVIGLGGYAVIQILHFRRKLVGALPASSTLFSLLQECQREFGIVRKIELLETDVVKSPALFGLFRLRLLLPKGLAAQFTPSELRYIFLHELAHVKRGDLWLNWLVTALQIVHWFNPLIWLGFARLRADRELACDEMALLRAGEKVGTSYGQTVIKVLEGMSRPAAVPGLIGILEDKKQMHRRILMIANFRKPGRWSALAIVLVVCVAAVALTDAQTEKPRTTAQSENPSSKTSLPSQDELSPTNQPIKTARAHNATLPISSNLRSLIDTNEFAAAQRLLTNQPVRVDGAVLTGVILSPGGTPARNAQVALRIPGCTMILDRAATPPSIEADSKFIAVTDEDGHFAIPLYQDAKEIIVTHANGFARISLTNTNARLKITLQPWARVEGTLRLNGHVASNEWVTLQPLVFNNGLAMQNFQDQTYGNGFFSIDHVPAGNYSLSRVTEQRHGEMTVSQLHPLRNVTLKPGQIARIWGNVELEEHPSSSPNPLMLVGTDTQYVHVGGEVKQPGLKPWNAGLTLANAIQSAGGFTQLADKSRVRVVHSNGSSEIYPFSAGTQSFPTNNPVLKPGDKILAPR